MKMNKDLYDFWDIAINETIFSVGKSETIKFRKNVNFVNDQFRAFCFGVFQLANRQNNYQLSDMAYKQNLNDEHFFTALKKILKDYKNIEGA